jgi:N-acetyltransferase
MIPHLTLSGRHVRLEPLVLEHVDGLVTAANADRSPYDWSVVPGDEAGMRRYVETALSWARAGTAVPFATVRNADGTVLGATRFFNLERWAWPPDRQTAEHGVFDIGEIGYTWLTRSAMRTQVNTEAKLLMLAHAFETWKVRCICFHADARNARSRAAIERIGARFEGILRSHRLAIDLQPRDSARFSIVAYEWPQIKERLQQMLRA